MPSRYTGEARQTDSVLLTPLSELEGGGTPDRDWTHGQCLLPHSLLHHPEHLASMYFAFFIDYFENKQSNLQTFTVCFRCHANRKEVTEGGQVSVEYFGGCAGGQGSVCPKQLSVLQRRRLSAVLIRWALLFLSTHFSRPEDLAPRVKQFIILSFILILIRSPKLD